MSFKSARSSGDQNNKFNPNLQSLRSDVKVETLKGSILNVDTLKNSILSDAKVEPLISDAEKFMIDGRNRNGGSFKETSRL